MFPPSLFVFACYMFKNPLWKVCIKAKRGARLKALTPPKLFTYCLKAKLNSHRKRRWSEFITRNTIVRTCCMNAIVSFERNNILQINTDRVRIVMREHYPCGYRHYRHKSRKRTDLFVIASIQNVGI